MDRLRRVFSSKKLWGTRPDKSRSSRQIHEDSGSFGEGRITWSNTSFGDWLNTFPAIRGVTRYKEMKRDYREYCSQHLAENFYQEMGFDSPEDAKVAILHAPAFKQITKEFKDVVLKDIELGPESFKVKTMVKEAKILQSEARKFEEEAIELEEELKQLKPSIDEVDQELQTLRQQEQQALQSGNNDEAARLHKKAEILENNSQEDRQKFEDLDSEKIRLNDQAQEKHFAAYKLFKEAANKGSYEGLQARALYKRIGIAGSKGVLVKKNVTLANSMLEDFRGLPKQQARLGKAKKTQQSADRDLETSEKLRKRAEGFQRQADAIPATDQGSKEHKRLQHEATSSLEAADKAYRQAQDKHYEAYTQFLEAGNAGSSEALFEAAKYLENGIVSHRAPDSFMAKLPIIGGVGYHVLAPDTEGALELTKRAMAIGPQRSIIESIAQYQRAMKLFAENPSDPKVLELLHQSSEYGYSPAASMLGRIHMEGLGGVPKDISKADHYFWRAVELSPKHIPMLNYIGQLYWDYAREVPKDNEKQYFAFLQKSAGYFARAGNRRSIDGCLFASARYQELADVYQDRLTQLKLRNQMAAHHETSGEAQAPEELRQLNKDLEEVRTYLGDEDTVARFFMLEGDWARKVVEMERLSRMYKDFAIRLGWPGENVPSPIAPRAAPSAPLPPLPDPILPSSKPAPENQPVDGPELQPINNDIPSLESLDFVPDPRVPVPIPAEYNTRESIVDYILFTQDIILPEDRVAFYQSELGQRLQQAFDDTQPLDPQVRKEFIEQVFPQIERFAQELRLAEVPEVLQPVVEQAKFSGVAPAPLVEELLEQPEALQQLPQLDTEALQQRLQEFMEQKNLELQKFFEQKLQAAIQQLPQPAPAPEKPQDQQPAAQPAPAPEPQQPQTGPTYNTVINVNIFNIRNLRIIFLRQKITRNLVRQYFINPQANLSPESEERIIKIIIQTLNEWKAQNQPKRRPSPFRVPTKPRVRFNRPARPAPPAAPPAPQAPPPPPAPVAPQPVPAPAPVVPPPVAQAPKKSRFAATRKTENAIRLQIGNIHDHIRKTKFKNSEQAFQKFLSSNDGQEFRQAVLEKHPEVQASDWVSKMRKYADQVIQ